MRLLKILLSLSLALIMVFSLTGCRRTYKIIVSSGEEMIDKCPQRAAAGETVRITTLAVCDADLFLSVEGDQHYGRFTEYCVYQFTMPDHDVDVKVWIVANGLA